MNTGEHSIAGAKQVQEERIDNGDNPALADLRAKLSAGLARNRINKTELARGSELGRTTMSEAFQAPGLVPSEQPVAALARALKLPVGELLDSIESFA
ncbi:helix-turn-helix domain-containing protein [Streptomyces sp. NPDC060022]|uniref:helix-turn-helix domain-containing protein n=1 Tax=Streptomyces sp. NPDC060022 TaxID=3347039 RepID=UPI003684754A